MIKQQYQYLILRKLSSLAALHLPAGSTDAMASHEYHALQSSNNQMPICQFAVAFKLKLITLSVNTNMKKGLLFTCLLALCCAQLPACPNSYLPSDIFTAQVSLGVFDPARPSTIILAGDDFYSYNYMLPMPFRKAPSVAISISDFQSSYSPSFLFSVKYLNNQNRSSLTFLVRIDQRAVNWTKLGFYFLAEVREDILAFTYNLEPNSLISDDQHKSETWVIPFLEPWNEVDSKVAVFLNGFDLYSKLGASPNNSSFELRTVSSKIGANGIVLTINCSSTTRVGRIYLSFIVVSNKATLQTVAFINQGAGAGETRYVIQPTGMQVSSQGSNLNPADMAKYKSILGISSFTVENNASLPRFYSVQFSSGTGEVLVNATGSNYSYLANNYLFLKADECSGCLGYNLYDSSRNTCVSFCPSSSYVEMGECKYCPAGQHITATGCVSCGPNQEWDGTSCKCLAGYYKSAVGNCEFCPAGTTAVNGKCQCPYLGQYFDEASKTCNCPPQMYVVSGKCQQCESGKFWDGNACIEICSRFPNMKWDGFSCACKDGFTLLAPYSCSCNGNIDQSGACLQCPPNTIWNGSECACKTGYKKTSSGSCVLDIPFSVPLVAPTYPGSAFLPGQISWSSLISTQGAIVTGVNTLSISVRVNNLPSALIQNGACPLCANLFVVQASLPSSFKTSIQYNGVSSIGSQSLFSISLLFDSFPTQNFNVFVKINPTFSPYFGSTDISQTVAKYVDLRTLSLSDSGKNMRKDILN